MNIAGLGSLFLQVILFPWSPAQGLPAKSDPSTWYGLQKDPILSTTRVFLLFATEDLLGWDETP